MIKYLVCIAALLSATAVLAQDRSPKRGVCWDEKQQRLSDAPLMKMSDGVSWLYNWGPAPQGTSGLIGNDSGVGFAPMCWNGNFDETRLRNYLSSHPDTRYLLGFNEPNFSAQANMTPADAAAKWPRLEAIAQEFGLKLVAPALNFTGERVGGRVWSPYEWLDEFIAQYKKSFSKLPRLDCLALHCYMNWSSAMTWFATGYFYSDLYDSSKKDVYGRYPNIVELLDAAKAANGCYPGMMLTEFCAYEGNKDGFVTNTDNQIDQMVLKVQALEKSDVVEGYAWFMANPNGGAGSYPYNSMFMSNTAQSELSDLGNVYVHMSAFDKNKYYAAGETIAAKDYTDVSTDGNQQPRLRPNTEAGSSIPLQLQMQSGSWTKYQITNDADAMLKFTLHVNADDAISLWFYLDGKPVVKKNLAATAGKWENREIETQVSAGQHEIMVCNSGAAPFLFTEMSYQAPTNGILSVTDDDMTSDAPEFYSFDGTKMTAADGTLAPGLYVKMEGNKATKIIIR